MARKTIFALSLALLLLATLPANVLAQTGRIWTDLNRVYRIETADDSLLHGQVNGYYAWYLSQQCTGKTPTSESQIKILTQKSKSSFKWMTPPDWTDQKGSDFEYGWDLGTIDPNSRKYVWLDGWDTSFSLVFDSERVITPTLIEPSNSTQTILVKVTSREQLVWLWVGVMLENLKVSTRFLDETLEPEGTILSDGKQVSWSIDNVQIGVEHTFKVQIVTKKVSQLSTIFYKPRVIIEGCLKSDRTQSLGSSMILSDELLGSVQYSAKGNYYWESGIADTQQVDYKEFYGSPTVDVRIEKPLAFASVSKSITIVSRGTASSGGIVSMRYNVDGGEWVTMKLTNNSGSAEWDSTSVSNGAHVITVEAVDSNGVSSNKSVTVIVDNTGTRSVVYGHLVNFGYLLAMVAVVVGFVWAKSKRSPRRIHSNPQS